MKPNLKTIIELLLVLTLFVVFTYLIQNNIEGLKDHLDIGVAGMGIFILIVASSTIFPPITSITLFPLASGLWGWAVAGTVGLIGQIVGAVGAYWIGKLYGRRVVKKLIPIKYLEAFKNKVGEDNLFWKVAFLRTFIPVDGVSYFIPLFTDMTFKDFFLASLIGFIPFTYAVAYFGSLSFKIQAYVFLAFLIIGFVYILSKRKK